MKPAAMILGVLCCIVNVSVWASDPNSDRMSASILGKTEMVRTSLEAGAAVNAKDGSGNTALKYAKAKNDKEMTNLLGKAGAKYRSDTFER